MNNHEEPVSADPIAHALWDFCVNRTQATFMALRKLNIDSPAYKPYSSDLSDVDKLFFDGKWAEARERLRSSFPNLITNPGAHFRLAFLHRKLNDEKASSLEGYVAAALLEAIVASGDGTHARPYLVARNQDEYDVLEHLKRDRFSQKLVRAEARVLDVWQCRNGDEVWFDITDQYRHLERTITDGPPPGTTPFSAG